MAARSQCARRQLDLEGRAAVALQRADGEGVAADRFARQHLAHVRVGPAIEGTELPGGLGQAFGALVFGCVCAGHQQKETRKQRDMGRFRS